MLTIEEIKEKFGDTDGYVSCYDCPLFSEAEDHCKIYGEIRLNCDGYNDAWTAIQNYLNGAEGAINAISEAADNPTEYAKSIIALLDKQTQKGLSKYGETLEDNKTLTTEQRIEHLQEELIDGLQYCEHLKAAYKDNLTANDYQRAALRTAGEKPENYLDNAILGLCGEVGEVADIIKKHRHQGHELDVEHLIEELGDVCWYVALMASAFKLPLEEVLQRNIDKLKKRYPDGFDKARSINRAD